MINMLPDKMHTLIYRWKYWNTPLAHFHTHEETLPWWDHQASQWSLDSSCFELVSSHQQGIYITCLAEWRVQGGAVDARAPPSPWHWHYIKKSSCCVEKFSLHKLGIWKASRSKQLVKYQVSDYIACFSHRLISLLYCANMKNPCLTLMCDSGHGGSWNQPHLFSLCWRFLKTKMMTTRFAHSYFSTLLVHFLDTPLWHTTQLYIHMVAIMVWFCDMRFISHFITTKHLASPRAIKQG